MNNASDISSIFITFGKAIYEFWWVIFPILFYYIFKIIWIDFVAIYSYRSWKNQQEWTVLEIIPPRDIEKSPKIMENIFTAIAGVHTTYNTFDEYLNGAFWHDRFSFEIVGMEGKLHFYVVTQKKNINYVEAQVYAQYPDAKVIEVPDYTKNFPKLAPNKNWDLWGTDFEFVMDEAIPIKTYDRFEESVTGEIIDPIASMAEIIGTLGPDQYIWLQYVIQILPESEKKTYDSTIKKLKGEKIAEKMGPLGHFKDVIVNIPKGMREIVSFGEKKEEDQQPLEFRLSPMEKDLLKATEENVGKNTFKTKMRYVFIAKKENWNPSYKGLFIGCIKLFNDMNFNQMKPNDLSKTYGKIFFKKPRADFRKRQLYDRYRDRSMDGASMIFSTKELATLYHFPSETVKAPSISRVESKLGSAPSNLPIE